MAKLVTVEVDGGLHRITMNRPEVMNALNRQMRVELLEDEVTRCLGLLGVTSFSELNPSYVTRAEPLGRSWLDSAFPLLKEGY